MTADEWLRSGDAHRMLNALRRSLPRIRAGRSSIVRAPERKLRLLGVAMCENLRPFFQHDWHRLALDSISNLAGEEKFTLDYRASLRQLRNAACIHADNPDLDRAVEELVFPREVWTAIGEVFVKVRSAVWVAVKGQKPNLTEPADLLREIFGNPFRPVAFEASWRTSTAVTLARQMFFTREFSASPILADALQEAGCENDDVLRHCRGPGPHVRGCWVVDGVIGLGEK
jgi:hypothetical protein